MLAWGKLLLVWGSRRLRLPQNSAAAATASQLSGCQAAGLFSADSRQYDGAQPSMTATSGPGHDTEILIASTSSLLRPRLQTSLRRSEPMLRAIRIRSTK